MSPSSLGELWRQLEAAGLTVGDMPEIEKADTPWYVRVMLGIAGLIAAGFLLGFIGMAFNEVFQSHITSVTVGLVVIATAYGVFRAAPRNDFTSIFALAVSIAGQALVITGIFRYHHPIGGMPWALVAALEAVLAVAMPNVLHRVGSAYATGLAFTYACEAAGAPGVAPGVVAAAVAFVWLNETRLGRRHAVVIPIGYGLTLAFVQIEGTALFRHSAAMTLGFGVEPGHSAWAWAGESVVVAALLVSVWILLARAGWGLAVSRTVLAFVAAAGVGAASFKAPGIAGGLMIALLGFANGERLLVGLAIAALLFYVCSYYYMLEATLLIKSGVMMATGIVLLATRWLVLNVVMPDGGRDA